MYKYHGRKPQEHLDLLHPFAQGVGTTLLTRFVGLMIRTSPTAFVLSNTTNFNMKPTHIEHIGIAVANLQESIRYYEDVLGLTCYKIEEVADQKVKTAFFMVGQTKIELLESTSPDGPIGKFVEKKGPGIHHIAFAMENVAQALTEAQEKGIQLIDAQPRKGAEDLNIGFLHPKSTYGVLTEFCGLD